MEKEKIKTAINNIEVAINKIENKQYRVYFFVMDSKGIPSGELSYEYEIAYKMKKLGYDVHMLYGEKEFTGVESWLGTDYSSLPHHCIDKDNVEIQLSDILIIPEVFCNVMAKTKNLPCKRIMLMCNYNYFIDVIPMGANLDTLGIHDCITKTDKMNKRMKNMFSAIQSYTIRPSIPENFSKIKTKKQLIVNIVSKNQFVINQIVKPFKWKHPEYGFVSFRWISEKSREDFAKYLNDGSITVWVDNDTDFGVSALEALASNNVVIAKVPENEPEWMFNNEELNNSCVWYYKDEDVYDLIAGVVFSVLHNNIPQEMKDSVKSVLSNYTNEAQEFDIKEVFEKNILINRRKELDILLNVMKNNLDKESNE